MAKSFRSCSSSFFREGYFLTKRLACLSKKSMEITSKLIKKLLKRFTLLLPGFDLLYFFNCFAHSIHELLFSWCAFLFSFFYLYIIKTAYQLYNKRVMLIRNRQEYVFH